MERGVERLASAGRALDKVRTGLKLVDTVLKIGEGAGLPLIPAVCSAARGVLQVVQESRTVITDSLSAAQRTIDVLELLQLTAKNVERMDATSRASVEDRMRELKRLLEDVRSAVAAFGKKGWLRHALNVKRGNAFSQLDSEITSQLDLLLQFYNLARDADILDRLQAREYPVEAEVQRQVAERKALGEAVDEEALEKDCEVVRGIAVASGVSDAEFQEELSGLRSEMRDGFASTGVKLDEIKKMMAALGRSQALAWKASGDAALLEANTARVEAAAAERRRVEAKTAAAQKKAAEPAAAQKKAAEPAAAQKKAEAEEAAKKKVNDEGNIVALGQGNGKFRYYCGQRRDIPGSDGHCGPTNGPQCESCVRFQKTMQVNDEGNIVALGEDSGKYKYYCGQRRDIPGSDGHCGPTNGPQCKSCVRYQKANPTKKKGWFS